jgi:hypothetical protein
VTKAKTAVPKAKSPEPDEKTPEEDIAGSADKAKEEKTCFVVMPFGGWFNRYYRDVYVPAIKEAGLVPRRADDLFRPSPIVEDIWALTNQAALLLADLTGKNPNVYYELGLAHAIAKPVVLVVQSMDDVPFDLRALRVLVYDKDDPKWGDVLREQIVKAIGEVLEEPLKSVPAAFVEVKPTRGTPAVEEWQKELLEVRQDLDSLRRELFGEARSPSEVLLPNLRGMSSGERVWAAMGHAHKMREIGLNLVEVGNNLARMGLTRGETEYLLERMPDW